MSVQTAERLREVLFSMAPTCVVISATEVSRKVNALADRYNRHTILQTQKRGPTIFVWTAIAQPVQRLATGWVVRISNSTESEIFRTRPNWRWGPPSIFYNGYRVSFKGVRLGRRGVDHPPSPSAEVKERVQLTSPPLPGIRGLLQSEICPLKLFRTKTIVQVPVKMLPQLDLQ